MLELTWWVRGAALEMLVNRKVTGLPVVDAEGRVVGVVSDYDMLALEGVADAQACETLECHC